MLLTLSTTHWPATDLGYLLHKHPERVQGSLLYRDQRFDGYAAAVAEVIEHLDPPRLAPFERVLFEFGRPPCVVLTTPNAQGFRRRSRTRCDT